MIRHADAQAEQQRAGRDGRVTHHNLHELADLGAPQRACPVAGHNALLLIG